MVEIRKLYNNPVKNVTGIFCCILVENETKSDGNPSIFLVNAMEIPWLGLVQNLCHVPAWKTNTTSINDIEFSWKFHVISCQNKSKGSLVQIHTKFHDDSMSFIQVLFVFHPGTWHGFWTSSSHGISMAFAMKMMGFPSDLVSFSNQTKPS